ncbi:hypothetical protein ASPVEDRAFT_127334 [Aspergillus versicolor CBS 583.65]|uniref:AT DNA binding protein n=1 Tax=Aspergillus versicolor CBS 583.65 TaxID=1036611 RepID=A0A1L9PEG7_ASPVE|nr:uncharacterized protein ASPVEDRAFT_127334 [Aspergillus versicolor CBS 583.65]OJI99920.1 hypothetical protein ASPVEDRAFT_127334 [Aspergillus versicolor CBS 583.65]
MFASHSSHSESSSPDILAPPGDADYLISSPFRPFPGRQSSLMSPANRRILQTPGAAKRKRSRISLSPAKSAHSIRFDDIVLPGSPTRNLDGRRSASPDKVDADGNVSPWRIRVTLEATQDDQENQGSPSRKRPKQKTTTTKVPLKDTSEQTPRRRGRPRKSGAPDTTPVAGSPGNTPGPANSEQKRRRGRPRKHKPESDATAENNVIENNEQPEEDVQMVDPAPAGTELERHSWSPLNLAGDADSDDGIYDNEQLDIPFEAPAHTEFAEPDPPTEDPNPQPSIEPTYDTPNGDAIDRFNYQQGDDELHSTPSKMPSPTRELPSVSPENSIHAGHTPMPPRTYPTPASTSLVDNEQPERNRFSREPSASSSKPSAIRPSDPTNEHREFDSIIESEGFSMVSLDTLPSAQQHGLRSNPKLAKGALKPFIERETNGVLRRKTNIPEHESEETSPPSPSPDPALSSQRHLDSPQPRGSIRSSAAKRIPFSPIPTKMSSPAPQRKPLLRLAKLVKAGIALERVLSHSNPPYSPGNAVPDYMAPRQRLEVIFSDLNPESQRVLGAALGLGQVLAIRRKMMELRSPQRRALAAEELGEEDDHASLDFEYTKREVSRTPNRQYDGAADPSPVSSSPDTDMKQRFAEWQRERDAVSRTIQMANSSQVIVIDSDVGTPNTNAGERDVGDLTPLVSQWNRKRHEEVEDDDYDSQEEGDDEYDNEEEGAIYNSRQSSREPRQEEKEEEEQGELEEDNYGNQEQRSDYDDDQSLWMPKQGEHQRAADEENFDVEKGRADYVASRSPRIPRLDEDQHSEVVEEDYVNGEGADYGLDADEDDGYEDIWQDQAKDEGNSGRESMLEPQEEVQSSPEKGGSTPAGRGYSMSFSPAHWVDGQGKMPSLGQSRVRELREQEVDISALLRAEDTPNRARYYYGKSSPLSSAQGYSPQHNMLSSAASHRQKHAERYENELGQLEEAEEPADYLDFSPEKDLEDETFQIDPTTRHESEMQRYPSDFADNASISDGAGDEPPVHEETLTPKNPAPANRGGQATSWYERITSLTPGWLKAPLQNSSPQNKHSSPPTSRPNSKEASPIEEQSEHSEQEDQDRDQDNENEEGEEEEEEQHPPQPDAVLESETEQIWLPSPQPKVKRTSAAPKKEPKPTTTGKSPEKPTRLETSGYFSNAHYTLLRRLYRLAKQSPESFTYHSSPSHSGIIGDYIWTSDNTYGVPVTELQFAIVYRFRQELAAEDLKSGGTGWVGWTDADLHRRLVSVIIGEQTRADRKSAHESRPTRSKPRSIIQRG